MTDLSHSDNRWRSAALPLTLGALLTAVAFLVLHQQTQISLPDNTMIVELVNRSNTVIDLVEIKHGNSNSQETLVVLQIRRNEKRRVVLNHTPGMGFNLMALIAGEKVEACMGKFSQSRILRQTFLENKQIEETDIEQDWF